MAWTGTLKEVNIPTDKTNDWFEFTVTFSNGSKSFEKVYRFFVDDLTDISLVYFVNIVKTDKDRLNKLDSIYSNLSAKIGASV